MAFGPQRRHAVASIGSVVHALTLQQHLMTPNVLVLLGRIFTQIQISASAVLHPEKSLAVLALLVVAINILAGFFHFIAFAANVQTSEGLLIDFVGQVKHASMMRILAIDLCISTLQLFCLTVSYLTSHPHTSLGSPFPYSDPLLAPTANRIEAYTRLRASEEGYAEQSNEDDGLNLDSPSQCTGYAPVILSLSLSHLFRIVLYYPSPAPLDGPRADPSHPGSTANIGRVQSSATEGRLPGQWVTQAG